MRSHTKNGNSRAAMRLWRLTLIQLYGTQCNSNKLPPIGRCPETDPDLLQFAHIHGKSTDVQGRGRGMFYRLKDVFENQHSYVLLCEEHHKEYDKQQKKNS